MVTLSRRRGTGRRARPAFLFVSACALLTVLSGCSHSYKITVEPPDASLFVNGLPAAAGLSYSTGDAAISVAARREGHEDYRRTYPLSGVLVQDELKIELAAKRFPVEIKLVNGAAEGILDGETKCSLPFKGDLAYGKHTLVFTIGVGPEQSAELDVRRAGTFTFRSQPEALPVTSLGIYPCGSQPKQIIFAPGARFVYLPLLNDQGFQIFDIEKREMLPKVIVGPKPKLGGFPEGLFIEKYKSFFITQMHTSTLFEYGYADDGNVTFRRSLPTLGGYPKFIAYAPSLDLVAVSNWLSNDVVLLDYQTGKAVQRIRNLATPRGLAFSPDDKFLFVSSYDGGNFFKFSTADWKEAARFYSAGAAMRHIALDPPHHRLFVDDMAKCLVFELDLDTLKLIHTYKTSWMPNTIALNGSGSLLFVSCRGPNNPKDYTLRSPADSVVMIFDTTKRTLVGNIQGGNQPTGLDVSADDRYLAFTNFQDADFELYDISRLCAAYP